MTKKQPETGPDGLVENPYDTSQGGEVLLIESARRAFNEGTVAQHEVDQAHEAQTIAEAVKAERQRVLTEVQEIVKNLPNHYTPGEKKWEGFSACVQVILEKLEGMKPRV